MPPAKDTTERCPNDSPPITIAHSCRSLKLHNYLCGTLSPECPSICPPLIKAYTKIHLPITNSSSVIGELSPRTSQLVKFY